MTIPIEMPQLSANGLSENWLFKFCGNQHWQHLCQSVGKKSSELTDDALQRLYPTFVVISSRYSHPLSHFKENSSLEDSVDLSHFGRSFFCSTVNLSGAGAVIEQKMITAFVARIKEEKNELKKSTPASSLIYQSRELSILPPLLNQSKQLRKGELAVYEISGHKIALKKTGLNLVRRYEPSPYSDFNGANLLYFSSYPTICDTNERLLIQEHALIRLPNDWALSSSTIARDIYYYRNLDLGEVILVRINHFEQHDNEVSIHTTLLAEKDGQPIADVFTIKSINH